MLIEVVQYLFFLSKVLSFSLVGGGKKKLPLKEFYLIVDQLNLS